MLCLTPSLRFHREQPSSTVVRIMPTSPQSRSSDDNTSISSDRSLIHSLSEVEEDSDDDRVEIGLKGTLAPPTPEGPISCVTPPRLSKHDKDQSFSSLVWAISPGATCGTPFATVISASPSHSLTLPFARPIGSPPRFHSSPIRRNNKKTPTPTPTIMSSNDDEGAPNKGAKANGSSSNANGKILTHQPEPLVPVVSLQTGLKRKASPLQLQSWCKLLLTLDGRDKFTKVLQYWSRLLAWWLVTGSSAQKRANSLKVSLTTSRKAFRLGRSVMEIQKLQDQGFWEWLLRNSSSETDSDPAWKVLGTALKTIGLLGFWAFDNASFLTGSGVLDDYSVQEPKVRLQKRQQLAASCSILANRSYFAGSVAGLITSWRSYREQREKLRQLLLECNHDEQVIKKAKQEQFVLFLALLKSCCDVLVFSNNPGLDFWKKARGKKMHEGLHCVAGLLSASTVLYNKYPNA